DDLHAVTGIDPWFLRHLKQLVEMQDELASLRDACATAAEFPPIEPAAMMRLKQAGFSDRQIAVLTQTSEDSVRASRKEMGIEPVVKLVDTCAAEFEAYTPYYYLTYERGDEAREPNERNIVILGGGPNRIGQGIEFDYCCVHAAFALSEDGFETVMVNCNPETVSTDYDTSDKLYFEPLTLEDVLNICDRERPSGVIVQFGGQTPLNLAQALEERGVKIIGTSPGSIARAEDREKFKAVLDRLGLHQPANDTAFSTAEAVAKAEHIGYPVVVRPSFVLGGRAMEIVYSREMLERYMDLAVEASPDHPILIDKFLQDAIEIDVDAIADGQRCVIGGIMEHIEEAGIHSGDSACVLPAFSLAEDELALITEQTRALAAELGVVGLINVQYAIKDEHLHVLEVNPRASRTVPFVSKAIGVPLAKLGARVMAGQTLEELGFTQEIVPQHTAVKCPVFPFSRFAGIDTLLGPEMKSTGEVMGIDENFGAAFAKAYIAAGHDLPTRGTIFLSVRNRDKRDVIFLARRLQELGFDIVATKGTAGVLSRVGVEAEVVDRVSDPSGRRRNVIDLIRENRIQLIINTPVAGEEPRVDQRAIRAEAVMYNIPVITTISGAMVAVMGLEAVIKGHIDVRTLQEYHESVRELLAAEGR
ncbi:MAG: carbamoyl-phosphate synthase large subunit, partial [Armatimonadetes bacterium]|nr:carbamoyl-phosphate synthase large subunit [Armatimonadota bacterium]